MGRLKKILMIVVLLVVGLAGAGYLYIQSQFPEEPPLAGVLQEERMTFGGRERRYLTYMPGSGKPKSILFMLHGSGSDPERSRSGMTFEFDTIADESDVLVVYPEGFENHWNDCRSALPYSATAENVDDVGFLTALKDKLGETYGIASAKTFVVGMSNGGHMAYRLAYETPDAFRGFAIIASNIPADSNFKCTPSEQPVSIMMIAGTEDPISPYEGGTVSIFGGNEEGLVQSAQDSADYWAMLAGYGDNPALKEYPDVNTDDQSKASALVWEGRPAGNVTLLTLDGGGHAVPHPSTKFPPFFGPTNQDLNGPREIWSFFEGLDP